MKKALYCSWLLLAVAVQAASVPTQEETGALSESVGNDGGNVPRLRARDKQPAPQVPVQTDNLVAHPPVPILNNEPIISGRNVLRCWLRTPRLRASACQAVALLLASALVNVARPYIVACVFGDPLGAAVATSVVAAFSIYMVVSSVIDSLEVAALPNELHLLSTLLLIMAHIPLLYPHRTWLSIETFFIMTATQGLHLLLFFLIWAYCTRLH